ncbi:MAG: DciA family protein [Planctomycetota bacterium]
MTPRRLTLPALSLGPLAEHVGVASVKVGVVTLEADSSALFQELESFQRQTLLDAFRKAGMNVHEVRVTLAH